METHRFQWKNLSLVLRLNQKFKHFNVGEARIVETKLPRTLMVGALFTPSYNMIRIFLSLSQIEIIHFQWNLFVSNGQSSFSLLDFRFSSGRQEVTTIVWLTVMDNPRLIYLNLQRKWIKGQSLASYRCYYLSEFFPQFWNLVEGPFSHVVT